jgi:uncharacterized protein YodC (DUF2158 family)
MALQPGEIVQLKSGGPLMTVVKVEDAKRITCMWFATDQGEYRTQVFEQAWLDVVDLADDEDEDED